MSDERTCPVPVDRIAELEFAVVPVHTDLDGYRWWCGECHALSQAFYLNDHTARWRALEHLHLRHDAGRQEVAEACTVDDGCVARILDAAVRQPDRGGPTMTNDTVIEYCRHWPTNALDRCGQPAIVIVWGKLADRGELGPRCIDHLPDWLHMSQIDQYAVFDLRGVRREDEARQRVTVAEMARSRGKDRMASSSYWTQERP